VLLYLAVRVAELLEMVLAYIDTLNKRVVDDVEEVLVLIDEIKVPLLSLVGE